MYRAALSCLLALPLLAGCAPEPVATDTGEVETSDELLGIGLSPNGPVALVGEQVAFTAKAFYADTTNEVINDEVSWVVAEPRVAEIDAHGVVVALAEGVTDIVATGPGGVSAKVQLTVKAAGLTPTGIVLSPSRLMLAVGEVVEVEAIANFPDGSAGNVSANCSFTSDAPGVVAMSGAEARGVAAGDTTVRASCDGMQASATARVTAPSETVDSRPDLRVTDAIVEPGDGLLEVLVEVENAGDANAAGFYLDLFVDPSSSPSTSSPYDETLWVSGLGAGQTKLLYATIDGVAPGSHTVWALADGDARIDEEDEGNNRGGPWQALVVDPLANGPQLEITTFDAYSDGWTTMYEVRIHNAGPQVATGFWVDLWLDRISTPSECEYGDVFLWVDSLDAGASLLWQPEIDDGPYLWWDSAVFVDSCDDVAESDELDNIALLTVYPE